MDKKNIPKPYDPYDYVREELRREKQLIDKSSEQEESKGGESTDSDSA